MHKQNKNIDGTVKVFGTVYSLVKRNKHLSDIESTIELQEMNGGVCFKYMLQCNKNMAKEMKMKIFKNIVEENAKICIIIDEIFIVLKKSNLVIHLQCTV